jgi:hypothetical protein
MAMHDSAGVLGYCYACGARAEEACRLCGTDVCREHAERAPNWEVPACGDCARVMEILRLGRPLERPEV